MEPVVLYQTKTKPTFIKKKTNQTKINQIHLESANSVPGPPVEVGVTMYVLSISSVSEVLMVHKTMRKRIYFIS